MQYIRCIGTLTAILCSFLQPLRSQVAIDLYNYKANKEAAIAELKNFPNPDTNRINALIKVFTTATFFKERQEVMPYRLEAMALSRQLNFSKGMAYCYSNAGGYYKSASNYPAAIHQYDSALYVMANGNDPKFPSLKAVIYERIGSIYFEQGNYYAALDHFFESLKYIDKDDADRKIRIYTFVTDVYLNLNNLDKATEYVKKSLELIPGDSIMDNHSNVFFNYI